MHSPERKLAKLYAYKASLQIEYEETGNADLFTDMLLIAVAIQNLELYIGIFKMEET